MSAASPTNCTRRHFQRFWLPRVLGAKASMWWGRRLEEGMCHGGEVGIARISDAVALGHSFVGTLPIVGEIAAASVENRTMPHCLQ